MKLQLFSILCAAVLGLTGCGADNQPPAENTGRVQVFPQTITAAEAKAMMEAETDFVLLDVRTEAEYLERRIAGAILLPNTEIEDRAAAVLPDQAQTILVYCRSGRRSAEAANALSRLGYTNVYDFGGLQDWAYDTVSGTAET